MYSDTLPADLSDNAAERLLVLGEMYDIPRLKHEVEEMLLPRLDEYNAIYYLGFASANKAEDLKASATRVILTNFPVVAESDEWRDLIYDKPSLVVDLMDKLARGYKITVQRDNDYC